MDRRGWPWKKKSSDKLTKTDKPFVTPDSVCSTLSSVAHLGNQQEKNPTNKNYVQIPMTGLEDQVANLEIQVKDLESKLSAAYLELDNKENLVKQHAKVAEEAVSGWEKADAEVVSLRCQLESITLSNLSCDERVTHLERSEKEVNSLKYELHVVSKEMDIRNEEKNMIMKSAEVANKRHAEDVKTIARLEGECQRRRGLLRKKLPGPAALAQMKLEVESTHRVISGIHHRKSSNLQESEFLSVPKRFEVFEEETTRLKEALASSNAELHASRSLYTKTVGRVKSLEAEIQILHQERSSQKSNLEINYQNSSSRISSNSPSITSISDSWHDDPESPVESFSTSVSDHFDVSRVRCSVKFENRKSETISELMDDFLEVEKMACSLNNDSVKIANKVKKDSKDNQLKSDDALVDIQLKCMTESYKSLQTHVEELEAENKLLKEKIDELKNELEKEKHRHHNALARHNELEEKMPRNKCLECTSNSAANKDIDTRKDAELAAAEKKLAQCQETLHVLGRQLQAMCPQIGSKRIQTHESLIKPSNDLSNSNGSYNSDEIDHAEACSVSSNSDIQGASDKSFHHLVTLVPHHVF